MEFVGEHALQIAPPKAECPVCKTVSKRHSIAQRKVREIDLDGQRFVFLKIGVYHCPQCRKHFRLQTGLASKWKHYGKRAFDKAFVAIRDDKTTFTGLPNRLNRDFHINPSKSTCHRWFHGRADKISLERDYEPQAVESFSGALAIDEVYDKEFCLFFATDPLNKLPLSFHLCRDGNAKELRKFLRHLKAIGITPEVLIVDGSRLYMATPQKVWPRVKIQLCIFHVIRNCQDHIQDAVRAFCKTLPKKGQWGLDFEPPEWWTKDIQKRCRERRQIRRYRCAFTTRSENLTPEQKKALSNLCKRHPPLGIIRKFQEELLSLFDRGQTVEQAWQKLIAMKANTEYQQIKHLQLALRRLSARKFGQMVTFLEYENLDATTNHVERTNRWFRKRQKTHYRNRKERTIRNMLKADLLRWSDRPVRPNRLCRKNIAAQKQVA